MSTFSPCKKLKPVPAAWLSPQAEPFLELRAALYEDEMGAEMKNRFNSGSYSSSGSYLSPNGTRTRVFTLKG